MHLTETCEPDAPHVITQVATIDAVVADTEMTEPVPQALAARGLLPGVHVVDADCTTAALFVSTRERGMELLGPAHERRERDIGTLHSTTGTSPRYRPHRLLI